MDNTLIAATAAQSSLDNVTTGKVTSNPTISNTLATQDKPQPKEYKSYYKKGVHGEKCMYPNRLDTYGLGCPANCSYCYARCQLEFRNLWFPDNPRIADIVKIEKTIKKIPPGSVVRLGGLTDYFQPLETKERVTFETIKLLNQHKIGYLIVTKSPLVASPEVIEVMDRELAHIQVTVTCLDPAIAKRYERTWSPVERVKTSFNLAGERLRYSNPVKSSDGGSYGL